MARCPVVVALIALCGSASSALAQQVGEPGAQAEGAARRDAAQRRPVRLRSATIDTSVRRSLDASLRAGRPGARRIIQLDGPMTPQRRTDLERAGVRVEGYLGDNAFLVGATGATPERVEGLGFIGWAGALRPEWKVAPEFGVRRFETDERLALRAERRALALVSAGAGADIDALVALIEAIEGAQVVERAPEGDRTTIAAILPLGAERTLAALDDVLFIEEAPEATLRNSTTRWIVQTDVQGSVPVYANGLTGAGQIVGLLDTKLDVNHCSFRDPDVTVVPNTLMPAHRKILAYNTTLGLQSHGTHVAGTVAGNNFTGTDNSDTRGVAYEAKIVFDDLPSLSDSLTGTLLMPLFEQHRDQGARVHTNSWGDDNSTAYTGWCRTIDSFMWNNEDNLVVFAETNTTTIRTPENAKNLLAVAATRDTPQENLLGFGGVGPTSDGRRKPDIMAPGVGSMSASSGGTGCSVVSKSGTSMAAPAVAGTALLARQYFTEGFYPSGSANASDAITPSGALLKATLLNSAQDMTGIASYPSNGEGWGRVTVDQALYFPGDSRELRIADVWNASPEALSTGASAEHTVLVQSPGEQLRITLSFTDAPAEIFAVNAAVNDLDLEVVSPTGVAHRGNVFNITTGLSVTGGSWDAINNVEQVHIASPEVGEWTVRIIGRAVNVGSQGYALVMTGDFTEPSDCPADISADGVVDGADLGLLLGAWGEGRSAPFDITRDGDVDGEDLGVLLGAWGPCP